MLSGPQHRLVSFGVFEFDPASGELWKAGRRIRLQNQPRQILRLLVSRPGELVSRDELKRRLWPDDTFVDFDNGLNVAIRKIRDALGDLAPSPRFIETERALGYRFIAPVSGAHGPAPSAARPGAGLAIEPTPHPAIRYALVAAVLVAAAFAGAGAWHWGIGHPDPAQPAEPASHTEISLAVLPFSTVAVAGDAEELLATGIPDGIITRLSTVRQFRVRPTSAVVRYRGTSADVREAGRKLECQYVLAGTIRATADRVRVTVQLVSTSDGSPIWADRYDVARGNLLSIEDAVADRVAGALRVRMSDAERERFYRRYTRSGAAYERYLMGRALLRSVTERDTRRAISEFEGARHLDPGYALAYAGAAAASAQLRVRFASTREAATWDDRARREAGRALQLDPDLAEAHVALAAVHRFQGYDWDTVIRESLRAIELNPSLDAPHLYLAVAYFHIGLLPEADAAVQAARRLNPENRVEPLEILGAIDLFAGRTADAVAHLSQVQDQSDSRIVKYLLAWTLHYHGERSRAEAMLTAMAADEGPLPGNARATLAAIRAARGDTAGARALVERVAMEADLIHHGSYGLATAYAQLRDPAAAVRWLSRAATTGFACYPWFERDPLLDPIRNDPGFELLMRELRRSWRHSRARYARVPNAAGGGVKP